MKWFDLACFFWALFYVFSSQNRALDKKRDWPERTYWMARACFYILCCFATGWAALQAVRV